MDPFTSALAGGGGGPSFTGGAAGPATSGSDLASRQDTGGLFSPFYFGGSGGGSTGFILAIGMVLIVWKMFPQK